MDKILDRLADKIATDRRKTLEQDYRHLANCFVVENLFLLLLMVAKVIMEVF